MSSQKLAETQTPPEKVEGLDYDKAIANIARLRDRFSSAESIKKQAEIEFQESDAYQAWKAASLAMVEAEKELRAEAIADFALLDNKKPHDALQIKMITTFDVTDTEAALSYCKESLPQVLSFKPAPFKKLMLALDASARPDCVQVGLKPRADIKTDLTEYAKKPEDDHGE